MILLIYGSGGLGREVYDLATRINQKKQRWSEISFINDIKPDSEIDNVKLFKFNDILLLENTECIVAVGEPNSREKLYQKLKKNNQKIATLIDPTVVISSSATIGEGCIICAFVLIANNVRIFSNVLVQSFVNIGHDILIGNHAVISSGVFPGGGDILGDKVYIGMGATIKEKLTIGDNSIIGMGACVFQNIPSDVIALGNPARVMRKNEDGKIFR